ncbi:hypothetical protein BDQ17DRAFT_1328600 [Cyathus striatus]|nr:hypothetical protein BDQ17DRAFT_1328600 [Cyathus striatus]
MWVEKATGCLIMLKGMAMELIRGKRDEGGGGLEDVDNVEEGHVLDDVASRLLLSKPWPSCKGPSITLRSHCIVAVVVTHRRRKRRDGCLMKPSCRPKGRERREHGEGDPKGRQGGGRKCAHPSSRKEQYIVPILSPSHRIHQYHSNTCVKAIANVVKEVARVDVWQQWKSHGRWHNRATHGGDGESGRNLGDLAEALDCRGMTISGACKQG